MRPPVSAARVARRGLVDSLLYLVLTAFLFLKIIPLAGLSLGDDTILRLARPTFPLGLVLNLRLN